MKTLFLPHKHTVMLICLNIFSCLDSDLSESEITMMYIYFCIASQYISAQHH